MGRSLAIHTTTVIDDLERLSLVMVKHLRADSLEGPKLASEEGRSFVLYRRFSGLFGAFCRIKQAGKIYAHLSLLSADFLGKSQHTTQEGNQKPVRVWPYYDSEEVQRMSSESRCPITAEGDRRDTAAKMRDLI